MQERERAPGIYSIEEVREKETHHVSAFLLLLLRGSDFTSLRDGEREREREI
jgi:hypothetical protein